MSNLSLLLFFAILTASFMAVIKDIISNTISGLWLRLSKEIAIGDLIRIKTEFGEKEGRVKHLYLRNVVLELDEGELLIESNKVFDSDVIRKRRK